MGLLYLNGLDSTASSHIDESYYLLSGLTMVQTGNYLYPVYEGRPRFQKPILPYWAVSLAYRLFGPGLAAARLPSLLCALLTVAFTYRLGRVLWESRPTALLSALALAANVMFFTFARLCITDMMFTLMVTAALYFFARWYFEEPRRSLFRSLSVLSMAVAVMVKGPLGLIIPLVTFGTFLGWRHGRGAASLLAGFFSPGNLLLFALVTLPWPLAMYHRFGEAYLAHVFLRETVERIGVTAFSLAGNALRYAWALVRYLFPWWLALLPFLSGATRRGTVEREGDGGEDGGRTLFLFLNIATVLLLLLFVLKTYSFKYLLPLTPAFSLLVGRQLAGRRGATRSADRRLRAFHLGATLLMSVVGLAGFGLVLAGFRIPEIRSAWPPALAALSLAALLLADRLRSRGRHDWAAGAVAGTMLLQLSLVIGSTLPLLRPDAVSALGTRHLKGVLGREDRIVAVGLDERRRAWLSLAAGRLVDPGMGDPPASHPGGSLPRPAEGRTYLVVREEELASLPAELRRRYVVAATAREFRRIDVESLLLDWKRGARAEIAQRAYYLLVESDAPDPAVEGAGDG